MAGTKIKDEFKELISPFLRFKLKDLKDRFGENSREYIAIAKQYIRDPNEKLIVENLEKLTNIKANYNLVDKGDENWQIDISEISKIIKNNKINFNENYLYKTLKKYYF